MLQLKDPLSNDLRCVGIDAAKAKFDVQIDNGKKPFTVLNTPSGRSRLIARLCGLPLASIVVESSGGYERPLLFNLLDAGLPVTHVNPNNSGQQLFGTVTYLKIGDCPEFFVEIFCNLAIANGYTVH